MNDYIPKYISISSVIPIELHKQLTEYKKKTKYSIATVIVKALRGYLNKENNNEPK